MDNIQDAPYVINSEDKQGLIVVITTFCLIAVWILFCTRGYIRKQNGPWKWDDTCVAIATVFTTVRSAIVYLEVHRGYGKSSAILSEGAPASIGKAVYGDNILYFIAMFFSKCAVLLLCQRMTPKKEHLIAIAAIFTCALLWALSSIMLVSINCSPGHPWVDLASQCTGLATRWKVICALDVVTEAAIFACSIYLVYGLHMSLSLKSIVITAFAIRLPTTIFSGIHLMTILREISSTDPTLAGAVTVAWRQLEVDFAICACTFSSLGAFLKPFDKELGPSRTGTKPSYGGGSGQQSYQMNSLASGNHNTITGGNEGGSSHGHGHGKKHGNGDSSSTSINLPILRPDQQATIATTAFPSTGSASDRMSVESNDSKKGIIMKHTMWTVDTSRNSDIEGSRNH